MATYKNHKKDYIEGYNVKNKLDKIVMIIGGFEFTIEDLIDLQCNNKVIIYINDGDETRKSPVKRENVENALKILKDFHYLELLCKSYRYDKPFYHPHEFESIASLQRWLDTITCRAREDPVFLHINANRKKSTSDK